MTRFTIMAAAVCVLAACSGTGGEEPLRYSITGLDASYDIPSDGGDPVCFLLSSNKPWTITASDDTWMDASPAAGTDGEVTVALTFAPNTGPEVREGLFTMYIGPDRRELPVRQAAEGNAPRISISGLDGANVLRYTADASSRQVSVSSNTPWRIVTSDIDWVEIWPLSGQAGVTSVHVGAIANTRPAGRRGSLTVMPLSGEGGVAVDVMQYPGVGPAVSPAGTVDGYRGIWFTIGQGHEYGDKYSGGLGTYTMKHIPLAVYTPEVNRTYFVYGGTPQDGQKYLQCMVGSFDHCTGALEMPRVVYDKGAFGVKDPHDDPTICIDKDGYIWVFVAGRGNTRPGLRFRSARPWDISSFEYINSSIMAYPQVFYDADKGFFLFFTRYDGTRQLFWSTSPDGVQWAPYRQLASIKEGSETKSGHYQISNMYGTRVCTAFNRHINGNVDTRTNIYYVQSSDWGRSWTNIAGETVTVPVTTLTNNALVRDYQSIGRNCYIKDLNFDSRGNPVILYLTADNHIAGPEGGIRQWHTLHWTGTEWVEAQFTTSTHDYDSGSIWTDGDEWTVIIPSDAGPQYWGTGGEIVRWRSSDEGRSWYRDLTMTQGSTYNHGYVRRPVGASDGFYALWADGNPDLLSPSRLYFCDRQGVVWRMPSQIDAEWVLPERVSPQPINH